MALAFGAVDGAAADPDGAAGADGAVEPLLAEALTAAGGSAGATGVLLLELQPSRPAQPRAVRAMANLRSGVTVSIVPWASTPRSTDLNSDVGESFGRWVLGDDEAVLTAVTSERGLWLSRRGPPDLLCSGFRNGHVEHRVCARGTRRLGRHHDVSVRAGAVHHNPWVQHTVLPWYSRLADGRHPIGQRRGQKRRADQRV